MFGEKGLVHVYTGDGKGKTTAALGLALRAAGQGARVLIVQFMKGSCVYGELKALRSLENVKVVTTGREVCIRKGEDNPLDRDEARRAVSAAKEAAANGTCDLLVLDEALVAAYFGLITKEDIMSLVRGKSEGTELVLTGRGAWPELTEAADLVTEMRKVKHPYDSGITARRGVEF